MTNPTVLEQRARELAIQWHGKQVRKYTHEPYWKHCEAVANLVRSVPHTPEMIAAGWLHDAVEDTLATFEDVQMACGNVVGAYVWFLSDTPPCAGNQALRKSLDRARLALAPIEVKTIKLADLIGNSASIIERDPDCAKVYLREKWQVLHESLIGGNPDLWFRAEKIVRDALPDVTRRPTP